MSYGHMRSVNWGRTLYHTLSRELLHRFVARPVIFTPAPAVARARAFTVVDIGNMVVQLREEDALLQAQTQRASKLIIGLSIRPSPG